MNMSKKEIRIALIGHQFMGIAHSNAFRNAAMWTDVPAKIMLKCICGYSYRFTPSLAVARQLVQEGRIGKIYHVFVRYAQDWITDPNFGMVWRFDKKIAGSGPLGDLSAHS